MDSDLRKLLHQRASLLHEIDVLQEERKSVSRRTQRTESAINLLAADATPKRNALADRLSEELSAQKERLDALNVRNETISARIRALNAEVPPALFTKLAMLIEDLQHLVERRYLMEASVERDGPQVLREGKVISFGLEREAASVERKVCHFSLQTEELVQFSQEMKRNTQSRIEEFRGSPRRRAEYEQRRRIASRKLVTDNEPVEIQFQRPFGTFEVRHEPSRSLFDEPTIETRVPSRLRDSSRSFPREGSLEQAPSLEKHQPSRIVQFDDSIPKKKPRSNEVPDVPKLRRRIGASY